MQEIIVYKDYGRIIRWQPSDENGVFRDNVRLDTGSDEGPRLMIYSTMFAMDKVRVLDGEIKRQFLELEAQIKALQTQRNQLIEANWNNLPALTWEYMKEHQDPKVPVPELFQHKTKVVSLRRGSKVMVDGSTEAVRWSQTWRPARKAGGLACKVGKLRKKCPKYAVVEIDGQLWRLPYHVLLPYDYQRLLQEKKRAKESEKLNRMSAQVSKQLAKIF